MFFASLMIFFSHIAFYQPMNGSNAPTNFSQRKAVSDEAALAQIFNRFARWQALRAAFQVLNFGALLWALVGYISAR